MANNTLKIVSALLIVISMVIFACGASFAAIGCTLNDPDRDIQRLFPQFTGYRTDFINVKEDGADIPYTVYTILKGKDVIGYVHGVNQKGTYGTIQIILATDPSEKIIGFYYQKISSPEAEKFRDRSFTDRFIGLTLADFYKSNDPAGRVAAIKDPTEKNHEDFEATIRGAKKSLILLDTFILNKERCAV